MPKELFKQEIRECAIHTIEFARFYEERQMVALFVIALTFYYDVISVGCVFSTASNKHKRLMRQFYFQKQLYNFCCITGKNK